MKKIQTKVIQHLLSKGFNCISQPTVFPDIIAWKPFIDEKGNIPLIYTETTLGDKVSHNSFTPYFITMVGCKSKKKLNKKENREVKNILDERRCNMFLVAYPEKKELKFQEIVLKDNTPKPKQVKKLAPSYLG